MRKSRSKLQLFDACQLGRFQAVPKRRRVGPLRLRKPQSRPFSTNSRGSLKMSVVSAGLPLMQVARQHAPV